MTNAPPMPPGERVRLAAELRGTLQAARDTPALDRRVRILTEALEDALRRLDPPLTTAQAELLKTLAKGRPDVAPRGFPEMTHGTRQCLQSLERRELCAPDGTLTELGKSKLRAK